MGGRFEHYTLCPYLVSSENACTCIEIFKQNLVMLLDIDKATYNSIKEDIHK